MERTKRRLAAIMCADAVNYSRLMEADEDGTLGRLKASREVMSGLIERHDGRLVNTWGDAVIVEFSSVVEAVQCAVEIQNELAHRNGDVAEAERMVFRIGLNLGDVMVEGDDIYGDGVNVAARLQQIADPGGILLSQSVYDQVRHKLAVGFTPLGPQQVKNVREPVETYRVRLDGRNEPEAVRPAAGTPPQVGAGDSGHTHVHALEGRLQAAVRGFRDWFVHQPRRVRRAVFLIGFFFVVNLLSNGLSNMWFVWPSLPFAMIIAWHAFGGSGSKEA